MSGTHVEFPGYPDVPGNGVLLEINEPYTLEHIFELIFSPERKVDLGGCTADITYVTVHSVFEMNAYYANVALAHEPLPNQEMGVVFPVLTIHSTLGGDISVYPSVKTGRRIQEIVLATISQDETRVNIRADNDVDHFFNVLETAKQLEETKLDTLSYAKYSLVKKDIETLLGKEKYLESPDGMNIHAMTGAVNRILTILDMTITQNNTRAVEIKYKEHSYGHIIVFSMNLASRGDIEVWPSYETTGSNEMARMFPALLKYKSQATEMEHADDISEFFCDILIREIVKTVAMQYQLMSNVSHIMEKIIEVSAKANIPLAYLPYMKSEILRNVEETLDQIGKPK